MKEPKFGRWTHVNERLPGRDERVLAADPSSGDQFVVTGGELATNTALHLWMPLAPLSSLHAAIDAIAHRRVADDV